MVKMLQVLFLLKISIINSVSCVEFINTLFLISTPHLGPITEYMPDHILELDCNYQYIIR